MSRNRPTAKPEPEKTHPSGEFFDHVLLGGLLTVLCLRVTITEAPPIPLSAKALILADPLYSVLISCVLLALSALWWLRCLMGRGTRYRRTGLEIGLGILFLGAALSSFGASDKRMAINHTVIFFAPALAGVTLIQLLDRPARVRLVLVCLVALGILSAAQGISQFTSENRAMIQQYEQDPNSLLEPLGIAPDALQQFMFKHRLYTRGVRSFFTTRNSAGCFGLVAVFAALALFRLKPEERESEPTRSWSKQTALLSIAVLAAGLVLSKSKGSALGLISGGLGFFLWHRYAPWIGRHRRTVAVAILLLGAALATLLALYGTQHGRLPGGQSMEVRWQYWQATSRMIADHPWLGVGPGNFASWYQHYKVPEALEAVADPHNLFLSILAQYGPLGLIGLWTLILGPCLGVAPKKPLPDAVATLDNPPLRSQVLIVVSALVTALLVLRPMLLPFPPVDAPSVRLYLYISQRLLPLGLSLGIAIWLLQPRVTGTRIGALTLDLARCGVLAVLVANLTDFAVFEPAILMGVWFLAACGLARMQDRAPRKNLPVKRTRALLGASVIISGTGLIYALAVRPVTASVTGIHQAQRAIMFKNYEQAQTQFAHAIQADPWSSLAPMTAGSAYVDQYEDLAARDPQLLSMAVEQFKRAIRRHPADYRPYERLAEVHVRLENWDQAYASYRQAATRYPGIARLQFDLGQIAEKNGDPVQAATHYQQAVAIEDRFRAAFARTYPQEKTPVSRLGQEKYGIAVSRLRALASPPKE